MTNREAKDFLVGHVVQQALLEKVPFSDVERRMMYFAEGDPASCENPGELNDEFEAQFDTDDYEEKVSLLLHHAYERLRSDDAGAGAAWKDAIATLRRGDHYLLVMWAIKPRG